MKVILFQLSGRGHPQDDATSSFFLNSKSPILGLSNDISFMAFFLLEGGSNGSNKKPFILGNCSNCHHYRFLNAFSMAAKMEHKVQLITVL